MPDPLNPAGLVALMDVNPAAFIPGVGCATATGLCGPAAYGTGVQGLPFDPQGAVQYGYGVNAAGTVVPVFKSAGYLCLAPFNPLDQVDCPENAQGGTVSISGNSLPQSPESSYSIGINKDMISDNGVTKMRVAYRYQAEREGNVFNQARARMPETEYLDVSLNYVPNDGNWNLKLYVKNLNDDQFIGTWAASSALQGGAQFATYTDPRTYGISFGTTF
jgi:outer membrane receptor protein involved in Fe transport